MDSAFEKRLIEALDALDEGKPIAAILREHPADAIELRPILETAEQLSELPPLPLPTTNARSASRQDFLQRAEELRNREQAPAQSRWRRFYFSFASFALFLILLSGVLVPTSQHALPGDTLYGVKRAVEDARLMLATGEQRVELEEEFDEERHYEVYEMLDYGREGVAGYKDVIKELGSEEWKIGNLTVVITDETVIKGTPVEGAVVEAHCLIKDGQVFAEKLEIVELPSE